MREFLWTLFSCFIAVIFYEYIRAKDTCPETTLQLNSEAVFILESVENDSLLMKYILSPTHRERTRQACEEFNAKYPQ